MYGPRDIYMQTNNVQKKKKKKLTKIDDDIFCFKIWKLQLGENDNS